MTRQTPLYENHLQAKANMVDFSGWDMPVQYDSLTQEYLSVRETCGIFDVCHMGRFLISGEKAAESLDRVTVSKIQELTPGEIRYTVVCNPEGGCKDDILAARLSHESFFVVVNASNREKIWDWFTQQFEGSGLQMRDITLGTGMVAIQGPDSEALVQQLFSPSIAKLPYYHILATESHEYISRTGYTGEDGFEIVVPKERIGSLWNQALALGAKPAGLGARDLLRLEMGFSLYGHEITEEISPVEAGLGWVVHYEKGHFIGKETLLRQKLEGTSLCRIALELESAGIPRQGCLLYDGDTVIGEVTSGSFSPLLKKGIGLGIVSHPPDHLLVEIRNKKIRANLVKLPFLPKRVKKVK